MLNNLIGLGALPANLVSVDFNLSKSISSVNTSGLLPSDTVVVDNCSWAATVQGTEISSASKVYSGNSDGEIGEFNRSTLVFYKKELIGNLLVNKGTISLQKNVNFMEEKRMDTLTNVPDPASLRNSINASIANGASVSVDNPAPVAPMDTFDDAVVANAAAKSLEVTRNQANGCIIGYITKTNSVIKVDVQKATKLDSDGKPIKGADGKAQKEDPEIILKNSAPSSIKGVIIKHPIDDKGNFKYNFFNIAAAVVFLVDHYDGEINESRDITPLATRVGVKESTYKENGVEQTGKKKASLVLKDRFVRKTLLTETNYFPLEIYDVANNAETLNTNVESIITKYGFDKIGPRSKDFITETADGKYTVDKKKFEDANGSVKAYYDKTDIIKANAYPKRTVGISKNGNISYKYVKLKFDDVIKDHRYAKFLKVTGMATNDFKRNVMKFGVSSTNTGDKNDFDLKTFKSRLQKGDIMLSGMKSSDEASIKSLLDAISAEENNF